MSSEQRVGAAGSQHWPKWIHAILMMFAGPLVGFLVAGFTVGFPNNPETFRAATMTFAYWLGIVGIGLIISWAVLIKASRSATWIVMLILTGGMGYMSAPMRTDLPGSRTAKSPSAPSAEQRVEPSADDPRFIVNEVIEELAPGSSSVIDQGVVQRFEAKMLEDLKNKTEYRFKSKGKPVPPYETNASTIHLQEKGHDIYATEITMGEPGTKENDKARIRVFWNIQDNKFKRVQCIFPNGSYGYRDGPCGRQLAQTFNWAGWQAR